MQSEQENNRIKTVIETSLKNANDLIDVSTVIGKPIKCEDGDLIFPISKVTYGSLSGGGEYGKITIFNKNDNLPLSAGNGTIISLKPYGFLIKKTNGAYETVNISDAPFDKLFEKTSEFISSITNKD